MSTRVGESTGYTANNQMNLFGWIVGLVVAIVLLPLLPVAIPAYLIWRVFFADEPEHSFETWRKQSGRPPNDS